MTEPKKKTHRSRSSPAIAKYSSVEEVEKKALLPAPNKKKFGYGQRLAFERKIKNDLANKGNHPRVSKAPITSVIKQKVMIKHFMDNGMKNMKQSALAAGYSERTKPGMIANTKTFKMLMAEMMPDHILTEKHLELLNKRDQVITKKQVGKNWETEVIDMGPNVPAVSKALDMAYKLKGAYTPEGVESGNGPKGNAVYNLFYKPEIQAITKNLEQKLKQAIYEDANEDRDKNLPEQYRRPVENLGGEDSSVTVARGGEEVVEEVVGGEDDEK